MPRLPVFLALLLLLCGCGSGRSADVSGDYLSSLRPARWSESKSVLFYRIYGGPAVGASTVRRTIRSGIHNWDRTFDGILTFKEATGDQQEDIAIRFVKVGSLGGDFFGRQTLARIVPVVREGRMESCAVLFDQQLWFRLPTLERLSAHEWGHAAGMNQFHSPYSNDLMYSDPATSVPNARDTRTARMVYGVIAPSP